MQSNDPTQPRVVLTVKARLEMLLDLEPRNVNFGTVFRSQGATRAVRLVGRDAAVTKVVSATIERLRAGSGGAEPVVLASLADGAQAGTVEVSLAPDARTGPFDGKLVVRTDHPEVPELTLRVAANVHGAVTFRPVRLLFRSVGESAEHTRTLMVAGADDQPVDVLDVSVDHPELTASFSKESAGRTKVTVTFSGEFRRDHEVATLLIRTSSPEDPRIEVPVTLSRSRRQAARPVRPPKPTQPVKR